MWRDLARIAAGTSAFVGQLLSRDRVEVALGLLAARSRVARRGLPNVYIVRIANLAGEPRAVTLRVEIVSAAGRTRPGGHRASLAKALRVRPRAATEVEIRYDWLGSASAVVDGIRLSPDAFEQGGANAPGLYSVSAVLLDARGQQPDRLTIYQELAE
jgi:hypothetical protein